jgi:hypothetical protein
MAAGLTYFRPMDRERVRETETTRKADVSDLETTTTTRYSSMDTSEKRNPFSIGRFIFFLVVSFEELQCVTKVSYLVDRIPKADLTNYPAFHDYDDDDDEFVQRRAE